ncbi:LysR substrate-binding domain-containing protein [Methylophilaceae bacterium]|jgi:LysR family hydrogen peroxide-inducible transcriptional activator|uniref:Transcriptional Regulator, LysR family protein n=1 Tax=Methylophilales bacterium HTCC2181 TaxID=383631 RepID=A0P512_9PROT|nr:Transcriptional Regulator, LysR family protein [Methylophilales bacterium HTCC2181]MBT3513206.1 LysR family transcriptional regulator [Nitrosomonadales bacterium]MCH9781972.1 LysR family transcriptional regulator [Betaproteobacteria bacterium]MCH9841861.1 LysR family transcriptional regulator [Betaproteobacteria bacterium]MDA9096743.1 LysR substrate-binding domain-containing protein [Methylophilaceae bacterium]|tara:strand:- start:74 stop:967 length:894 start_codon:yes stop_codon:yes gene_type:complete
MTLSELRFIVAVGREKNFRKAADKCFVSQPALSLAVKKLEDELGIILFERSRTDVSITQAGQAIINQAIIVLDEAGKIKEMAQQGDGQLEKPFKLGLIYSIAPYLLPLIIPLLRNSAPDMPLEIEENITKNLEEKLKKGFIDAAIVALPFDIPGIEIENLYEEPFVTVVPVKHPWAQKKTIKADLLASEKVLLLDNTHCYSNQVQEACPGLLKTGEIQGGNSLETIRSMVASNLGISVLPKSATTLRHVNPLVKVIQFDKPIPFRKVVLAYRKSSVKKQALEEVVKSIKKINTSTFN